MIAPGSGLAMLIASLVIAAHPLPASPTAPRESALHLVPTRLDADARRVWRRAVANDDARTLTMLLDKYPHDATLAGARAATGKSALMVAGKVGDLPLARRLVAAGADPRAVTETGGTPLMFAVLGDRLELARWLHRLGGDVDARGSNGWSATMIAAAKGLEETLDWLLSVGADAERADVYGYTPLMRAVDNAHVGAARRLLAAEVAIEASDERGNTALHHAVAGGRAELIALLLDHGADPDHADHDGLTPADLARAAAADGAAPDGRPRRPLPPALLARLTASAAD